MGQQWTDARIPEPRPAVGRHRGAIDTDTLVFAAAWAVVALAFIGVLLTLALPFGDAPPKCGATSNWTSSPSSSHSGMSWRGAAQ